VDGELRRLAGAVIESHLPALAKGHLTAIAGALGVQRSMIEAVLQLIKDRLRPRPAFDGPAGTPNRYIVPDLVIRESEIGTFTVQVVEPMRYRLRVVSPHQATGSGPASGQLRDSVHAAQSLLAQLHDRWQTLQLVADCTVHRQQEFLRHGPIARKPLTRKDIATELGLHESTVSRAVAGKYALLPSRRLIPLDAFFGVSGGLDAELRRLIESEQRPLSDQEIADRLGALGYQVARRTVAKHRIQLGIGSASRR
jgi:RNA polymerase sigma-54 factor